MKNFLLLFSLLFSVSSFSQTNLTIEISHKLNGEDFAFLETGINNLEQEFMVDRLEYYLSKFEVTHDGGQTTEFTDVYALLNAEETSTINLGEIDAENIEMLAFNVGVDYENNHADPAAWPSDHPLAPQFPSMHWGWASGYRFLAIEGIESNENQIFQVHGLGDQNYMTVELPVEANANSNNITFYVQANTEEILYDIDLSGGVFIHGFSGAAAASLENMSERVFEITNSTLSSDDGVTEMTFSMFPNPTNDSRVQLNFAPLSGETYRLYITDISGRTVLEKNQVNSGIELDMGNFKQGIYLVSLVSDKATSSTLKLIVK